LGLGKHGMKPFHFGIAILLFSLLPSVMSMAQDAAPPRLLPDELEVITTENAGRLEQLAVLGATMVQFAVWSPDGATLVSARR
jgi:hypothetical protein